MTSKPVYTSTAEGFRDAKEIAGLRPVAEPKPRAPRKASNPALRQVTSGIVCFCGERFGEPQALEFMLHLRAEVGEVLDWKARFDQIQRDAAKRYRQKPEVKERMRRRDREYNKRPEVRERGRLRDRVRRADPETSAREAARLRQKRREARERAGLPPRIAPEECEKAMPPVEARKALRVALGLTQSQLGAKAKISRATIQKYEGGNAVPQTLEMASRYTEALGWKP